MAADSVTLLSSINGTLKSILTTINSQAHSNKTQQVVTKEHRGGLEPSNIKPQPKSDTKSIEIKSGNIKISDIVSALSSLPDPIKNIAKLKEKEIKNFSDTLLSVGDILVELSNKLSKSNNIQTTTKLFKSLESLSTSIKLLAKLNLVIPFALASTKLLRPLFIEIGKISEIKTDAKAATTLFFITNQLNGISKVLIKMSFVWPLIPGAIIGVKLVGLFFNAVSSASNVKLPQDSVQTVKSILEIVHLTTVSMLQNKAFNVTKKQITSATNLQKVFKELVAGIEYLSKVDKKQIEATKILLESLKGIGTIIKTLGLLSPLMPLAIIGAKLVKPIFKTLASLCSYVGNLKGVERGIKNIERMESFAFTIIKFALAGAALVLTTIAVGALISDKMPLVFAGLGVISAVLVGYTLLATLAGVAGKYVTQNQQWFMTIVKFALAGIGLTVLTAAIGALSDKYGDFVWSGLLFISTTLLGYTVVAWLAGKVGEYIADKEETFKSIRNFALLGAGLVILSAILGGVVSQVWDYVLIGFASIAGVLVGTVLIAALINLVKTPAQKAIKDLMQVQLLFLASAGLIFVAAIVGGVLEQVWDYVLYGFTAISTMLTAIIGLSVLIKKAGGASRKQIANLYQVELLYGGAAGLIIVSAIVGAIVKKYWDDILFGFGAISTMLGLVIGTSVAIKKAGTASRTAIRNIALIEALLGGCEALVAAVIAIDYVRRKANTTWDDICGVLTNVIAMLGLVFIIGKYANQIKITPTQIKKIRQIQLLLGATELLVGSVIAIDFVRKKAGVTWDDIIYTGISVASVLGFGYLLTKVIKKFGSITKTDLDKVKKSARVVAGATLILGELITIEFLRQKGGVSWMGVIEVAAGVVGVLGAVAGLGWATKKLSKMKVDNKVILNLAKLEAVVAASGGILWELVAIEGKRVKSGAKWGGIFIAMGALATVFVALVALSFAAMGMNEVRISLNVLKQVALSETLIIAAGAVVLAAVEIEAIRKRNNIDWDGLAYALIATGAVLTAAIALAKIAKKIKVNNKAILALAKLEAVVAGAAAVLTAVIGVESLRKVANVKWKDLFIALGAMGTILAGVGALALVASKLPGLKKGVIALFLVEAVALGAAALLTGVIGIIALKQQINCGWDDVFIAIGAMATIVLGIGAIATAAGFVMAEIILGTIALVPVIGVTALSCLVLEQIINLVNVKNQLNCEWEDVFTTLGAIGTILVGVGAIATGAAFIFPALVIGAVALAAVIGVVSLSCSVALKLVILQSIMNQNKLKPDDLGKTLRGVTGLFTMENLDLDLGIFDILALDAKYVAIIPVIGSLLLATEAVGKMARTLGNMDDKGKIRPLLAVDKDGNPTYGNPVDIKKVTKVVTDSLVYFAKAMSETFKDLDIASTIKLAFAITVIGNMVNPVSKFAEMLTSFESVGKNKIRRIEYDKDGKLIDTPAVDIVSVSQQIADSISAFGKTLFSQDNVDGWMTNILKRDGDSKWGDLPFVKTGPERAMGILANIISPVCEFADMLSQFESGEEGELLINEYDEKGKLKTTRHIKVVEVATNIANAVSAFAKELFTGPSMTAVWEKLSSSEGRIKVFGMEFGDSNMERAIGAFGAIIDPVVKFVNMLTTFTGPGGTFVIPPEKEGEKEKVVNIQQVAQNITNSIKTFVMTITNMFGDDEDALSKFKDNTDALVEKLNEFNEGLTNIKPFNGNVLINSANQIRKYISLILGAAKTNFAMFTVVFQGIDLFIKSMNEIDAATTYDKIEKICDSLKELEEYTHVKWTVITSASISIGQLITQFQRLESYNSDHTKKIKDSAKHVKDMYKTLTDVDWDKFNIMTNNFAKYVNILLLTRTFDFNAFVKFVSAMKMLNSFKYLTDTNIFGSFIKSLNKFTAAIYATNFALFESRRNLGKLLNQVLTLNFAINETTNILNNAKYPTPMHLLSIEYLTRRVVQLIANVGDSATNKRTKRINAFAAAIRLSTTGMKNFDAVLANGEKSRAQRLSKLGYIFTDLNKRFGKLHENLKLVKDTIVAIEKSDKSKLQEAVKIFHGENEMDGNTLAETIGDLADAIRGNNLGGSSVPGINIPRTVANPSISARDIETAISDALMSKSIKVVHDLTNSEEAWTICFE